MTLRETKSRRPTKVLVTGSAGFIGAEVCPVAVQPDGRVLIGGTFSIANGEQRRGIVRLLPDGAIDSSFTVGSGVGYFTQVGGVARNHLARINANGTLDAGFNPDAGLNGIVRDLVIEPSGMILAGGDFVSIGGVSRRYIARIRPGTGGAVCTD